MNRLLSDVTRLRRACPWYQAQTFESLRAYLTEETQEVFGALDEQDPDSLEEELGDLLFQIILYCQLASERGWFSMRDVINSLHRKIVRRNPHVFGNLKLEDLEAVNRNWQLVKASEKKSAKKRMNGAGLFQILMEGGRATVILGDGRSVTFSTLPPPAEKFASGYTLSAWIWSALDAALETAKISMSDDDRKEIVTWISEHVDALPTGQ